MNDVAVPQEPIASAYKEDDLVYVDPDKRMVVGLVEWQANGKPRAMLMKEYESAEEVLVEQEAKDTSAKATPTSLKGKVRKGPPRKRYYPWGTYRSMKRVYKLEGKQPKQESSQTLDEVIEKALQEPFWD